jgi:hypothetical protein
MGGLDGDSTGIQWDGIYDEKWRFNGMNQRNTMVFTGIQSDLCGKLRI